MPRVGAVGKGKATMDDGAAAGAARGGYATVVGGSGFDEADHCRGCNGSREESEQWLVAVSNGGSSAKVAMEVEEPSYGGRGTSPTSSPGTHHATAA
ncbi:putative scarecrow-like protein 4 isoform X1 [Sesbania bispinosa]|nr:putative scarecrow-like protein 4 isoform X1 [Sesbania bispinosa]